MKNGKKSDKNLINKICNKFSFPITLNSIFFILLPKNQDYIKKCKIKKSRNAKTKNNKNVNALEIMQNLKKSFFIKSKQVLAPKFQGQTKYF